MNYAFINSPKPEKKIKKHVLICKINSYTDMGHLKHNITFENNTKYLNNFDQIKEDMLKYWNNNIYNIIKIRTEIHDGFGFRFFELKDQKNDSIKKTIEYGNVVINLVMTHE